MPGMEHADSGTTRPVIVCRQHLFEQSAAHGGRGLIQGLIEPERFEAVVFEFGICGIKRFHPFFQRREYLFSAPLLKDSPGLVARPALRKLEGLQQVPGRRTVELRRFDQRASFGGYPPDAAMDMIAAWISEIDLAVLDNRVVPVGNV